MNTLSDALQGAYEAHEHSERGRSRDPHRVVGAVRRRRVVYAAGTGTAAAVAVGAVALGATQLPAPWNQTPAASGLVCTDDPFGLANAKAFGALEYVGRSYIDPANDLYVFIHADGTREDMALNSEGAYTAIIDGEPEVIWVTDAPLFTGTTYADWTRDWGGVQGHGYAVFPGADVAPDTWVWTMDVPDDAPEGVNLGRLSWVLLGSMVGIGRDFTVSDVPTGATVELIARGDGIDVTRTVGPNVPGPGADEFGTAANSIELRVTLADGSTYTMTAHHDPEAQGPQVCVTPSPTDEHTTEPSPDPTASSPTPTTSAESAAFLSGPESAVAQCGAPLRPDDEGGQGFEIEWVTGERELKTVPEGVRYETFDFGAGDILATAVVPNQLSTDQRAQQPGWAGVWGVEGDQVRGVGVFGAPLWLVDGVVLGYGFGTAEDGGDGRLTRFNDTGDGSTHVSFMYADAETDRMACDGVDASALDGAELVFLYATGPVAGPYEFGWTRVER